MWEDSAVGSCTVGCRGGQLLWVYTGLTQGASQLDKKTNCGKSGSRCNVVNIYILGVGKAR